MIEVIGILAIWTAGLVLVSALPTMVGALFARHDDGLKVLIIGAAMGKLLAIAYVVSTLIYFIVN